jgi:hypothetical protein
MPPARLHLLANAFGVGRMVMRPSDLEIASQSDTKTTLTLFTTTCFIQRVVRPQKVLQFQLCSFQQFGICFIFPNF